MPLHDAPIRRKLMAIMLLTSGLVVLLTCAAFMGYEILTFRIRPSASYPRSERSSPPTARPPWRSGTRRTPARCSRRSRPSRASAARSSTTPMARSSPSIRTRWPGAAFPQAPGPGWIPVRGRPADRLRARGAGRQPPTGHPLPGVRPAAHLRQAPAVRRHRAAGHGHVCFWRPTWWSRKLQHQISRPILALAGNRQGRLRAPRLLRPGARLGLDELGLLTDAFNHMLGQVDAQSEALKESEGRNRAVIESALDAIVSMNHEGLSSGSIRRPKGCSGTGAATT